MTESRALLQDYATLGSEEAFKELTRRYVDLVYSTALRRVNGDAHLAEDVTQMVFADLARMAPKLTSEVLVGGWLHRHTCHIASHQIRSRQRRESRERDSVAMNALQEPSNLAQVAPIIDEAINELDAEDRTAILARFFERRDFNAIGQLLGSSEEAARKRVSRALDKLEGLLKKRGFTMSAAALGAALMSESVSAAPAGVLAGLASSSLATSVGAGVSMFWLHALLTSKIALLTVAVGVIAAAVVVSHERHKPDEPANVTNTTNVIGLPRPAAMNEHDSKEDEAGNLEREIAALKQTVRDMETNIVEKNPDFSSIAAFQEKTHDWVTKYHNAELNALSQYQSEQGAADSKKRNDLVNQLADLSQLPLMCELIKNTNYTVLIRGFYESVLGFPGFDARRMIIEFARNDKIIRFHADPATLPAKPGYEDLISELEKRNELTLEKINEIMLTNQIPKDVLEGIKYGNMYRTLDGMAQTYVEIKTPRELVDARNKLRNLEIRLANLRASQQPAIPYGAPIQLACTLTEKVAEARSSSNSLTRVIWQPAPRPPAAPTQEIAATAPKPQKTNQAQLLAELQQLRNEEAMLTEEAWRMNAAWKLAGESYTNARAWLSRSTALNANTQETYTARQQIASLFTPIVAHELLSDPNWRVILVEDLRIIILNPAAIHYTILWRADEALGLPDTTVTNMVLPQPWPAVIEKELDARLFPAAERIRQLAASNSISEAALRELKMASQCAIMERSCYTYQQWATPPAIHQVRSQIENIEIKLR